MIYKEYKHILSDKRTKILIHYQLFCSFLESGVFTVISNTDKHN